MNFIVLVKAPTVIYWQKQTITLELHKKGPVYNLVTFSGAVAD